MFQFRLRTLMIVVTLFCIIVGGCLSTLAWFDRTGVLSFANYGRIQPGMALTEVERLLGGRGREMVQSEVPQIGPLNHAAVVGDQYFGWFDDHRTEVIVSLRRGVVAEKYFWEPSF